MVTSIKCFIVACLKIDYNTFVCSCIWLSACVAFQRGLIVCFDSRAHVTRWRLFVTLIVFFSIAIASATPVVMHKCGWDNIPGLQTVGAVFICFYIATGPTIYVLATVLVLISFPRRIRRYGTENGSFIQTFLKLLYLHMFIFIPSLAYGFSYVPYAIAEGARDSSKHSYFQCGISTGEYIIKVLAEILQSIPTAITWLIFIYPSTVYMAEVYMNTWSGQHLAKILLLLTRNKDKNNISHTSSTSVVADEFDNRELRLVN
ncbi:unnamed protein product [Rotaria socialis]|uniref:Uncharacterized protein n=2 Tax=Rotaria socialis TaxID=392032 RepID=A0A818IJX9_9BILA|nr:unnamed protein product [Rotaria socialis]CAF4305051.1 unnamed protein product [Rotaria socialis]